ncbi:MULTISPECIES: radical SAM protein [unclassified Pseudovibrio]|uniref:radical SAM protein n=1 Tax=unclassified Pseudovibrio TaxID=2627060 RepID=UPI0007B26063|nr:MULTISPECIES: radical SAM protein [unclassified Pseudovibrio]KZK95303.1 Oxygen-independent coproporphyrinogen-III oxidase [Pseudovibrio sp. W74]KZL07285.1 Oxygen-independent coproporphyrinogen-III oxidase [Pseudovibrio sp. Ad14]
MVDLRIGNENLLNTRFKYMARNTIDYWMVPDSKKLSETEIVQCISAAPVTDETTFQLYLHIPFCAQKCSFCAFSGGNTLDFANAGEYIDLLIQQLRKILQITPTYGQKRIRSIHIGGGSPDLVRSHIGRLLSYVRSLEGMDENTEIAVECAPATTKPDFLDELIIHDVTKLSFGVQSINPDIRANIRLPRSMRKVEELCEYVGGKIPIVNTDFITGLPGQTLADVEADLDYALKHPIINAVSTYLLTPGAAPSLVADVKSEKVPHVPTHKEQAIMRLHSYSTLQQSGWVRCGTNTYVDKASVSKEIIDHLPGNECIGAAHYDTFLIAAGAQAIGSAPGVRFENTVDINHWKEAVRNGEFGFNLRKSALHHQKDMSLWTFPLFYEGLRKDRLQAMIDAGDVDEAQLSTLQDLINEALVIEGPHDYRLSILGEVFMGHIVRLLKKEEGQKIIDAYIHEGFKIGEAINAGVIDHDNTANNRQSVVERI